MLTERLVEGGKFLDQHAYRPAVGDDVVLSDQQHVYIIRQAQQTAPNQRALTQVKRCSDLAVGDA